MTLEIPNDFDTGVSWQRLDDLMSEPQDIKPEKPKEIVHKPCGCRFCQIKRDVGSKKNNKGI